MTDSLFTGAADGPVEGLVNGLVEGLVRIDRVHSKVYTDPTIFDGEIDRIFHRGWVFVGHESEIPEPGDFRTKTIGRQPVIMVRGTDGIVRVLMNRCTHRGTVVCPHERGNTAFFTCAYHSWTFRNSGELAVVPHPERYDEDFDKAVLGLRPAPLAASYREFVFACLDPHGPTFDEYLNGGARRELDLFTDIAPAGRVSVTAGTHKYAYSGNWKLQVENNVDAYHFNVVHRSFWQIQNKRGGIRLDGLGTGTSAGRIRALGNGHVAWDYRPLNGKLGRMAVSEDPRIPDHMRTYYADLIARDGADETVALLTASPAHAYIFPNLALIGSQIRVMNPIAVDRTEVLVYPALLIGAPDELNERRMRGHEAFYGPAGGGATDDFEIFARVQTGLQASIDPWVLHSRGLGMEAVDAEGFVSGQITDELGSRAIFSHWYEVMSGRSNEPASAPVASTNEAALSSAEVSA
jgi:phenylpropionate dioxygenase-like ring-hydroxylating dioxygenase large terminal subunit